MWTEERNCYAIIYWHLCFRSAIIIFSLSPYFQWMETPQFDWKVIEGPLKANKFLAKVVHVHMKLENSASE